MKLDKLVRLLADILKAFDSSKPKHKNFQPGIELFGEPQLVREICRVLELFQLFVVFLPSNPSIPVLARYFSTKCSAKACPW